MLPLPIAQHFGRTMGILISRVVPGRSAMAARHFERVTGRPASSREVRAIFGSYGRYYAELFWARPGKLEPFVDHMTIEGEENLDEPKANGKGIILVLPHTGNWEVAGLEAVRQDVPVLAVAENLPNRYIREWFVKARAAHDIEIAIARKGVTAELVKRLQNGGTLALPSDRDLSGRGVKVNFFGEETTLPLGPGLLAERTGSPIIPVGVYFRGRGHHLVVHPPLPDATGADVEQRLRERTQGMAEAFEKIIRLAPEQWHMLQPNWPSDRAAR
ncbi:MAG: phosphatidylinositol mannoside acyltransferase [Acidimicrobiia bacterium]|nr:phosphatidylinositol mannoside acyltransferase [Acidimicrobiia bacterium]MBT8249842.1 phosphatidylinositol mannoside acyltransferase [Acidimicrobiia bacterium]NNL28012.1 phosphatidylinositol mannoside acyltransferase [Acidimicrobiia bacterium]NNL47569.1 phosphatidylinositol mannoside acyltransferase [Acidimicrobiia bacterium]